MDWNEFYRSLTWSVVFIAGFVSLFGGCVYVEVRVRPWMVVIHAFLIVVTVLGISIIGGMGWGMQ
jgi:hypothetical protein